MKLDDSLGLQKFLRIYSKMAIRPSAGEFLLMEGKFEFSAQMGNFDPITECYDLRISVRQEFPRQLPAVHETGGRIPHTGQYHVNPDGSLCLGSPIRMLWKISNDPTLTGFAKQCIVPYLYAISHKLIFGGKLPFGELPHGTPGELEDYMELFGLKTIEQVRLALQYLGMKKRRANKLPCPCGCGRRLGVCSFNRRIRTFRLLASRSWYRSLVKG
jgi:hypothetical protein